MSVKRFAAWSFVLVVGFVVVMSGTLNSGRAATAHATAAPTLAAMERMVALQATKVALDVEAFDRARDAVTAYRWQDALSLVGPVLLLFGLLPLLGMALWWVHDAMSVNILHRRIHRATTGNVILGADEYGNVTATPIEPAALGGGGRNAETYTRRIRWIDGSETVTEVVEPESYTVTPLPETDEPTLITNFFERAMQKLGGDSVRVPTQREMGISGRQWDKVVNHPGVNRFLDVRKGRGGGTFLRSGEYVNLRQAYIAARRGEIPPSPAAK